MAKVTFLAFYADYCIAVHDLYSILKDEGHDVSAIFFKLESIATIEWFKENPYYYEKVSTSGDIIGYNGDVNKWTDHEVDLLIEKITELSPDVLCVTFKSPDREVVLDVLPKIKSRFDGLVIAGGFGPSLEPEFYVDIFNYIFIGECENEIVEIVSAIEDCRPLSDLSNVCYKKNGTIVKNKLRQPEIGQFRLQEMHGDIFYIENDRIIGFHEREGIVRTHTYSTFFGKGCIESCSYCSAGQWYKLYGSYGIKVPKRRKRPLEEVIDELRGIKDKGYTFIHFRDEYLYAGIEHLKRFFHFYEREICLPFWAFLVPQQILAHPELLRMAVDSGFVDTEIGFQSGSDRINQEIYTRNMPNSVSVAYAKLLDQYDINMKYDFIIFNPAETEADIKKTFDLIQALPKKRAYLQLARLHYFPMSPIVDIFKDKGYCVSPEDFDYYYRTALLYLLCFVLPPAEFDNILNDGSLISSSARLLSYYKSYLSQRGIEFPIGTHDVPRSITTHRYQRLLQKNQYKDVILWGAGHYYEEMASIFEGINIHYHIDDEEKNMRHGKDIYPPDILGDVKESFPIFICSPRKQEIKMKIINEFPDYPGRVFV